MWMLHWLGCIALFHLAVACENASRIFWGLSRTKEHTGYINAESVLEGPIFQLGKFEECEQYCLSSVRISSNNNSSPLWQQIQKKSSVMHYRRDLLYVGLCVPESCSLSDVHTVALGTLEPAARTLGVNADITLDENTCQSRHRNNLFTTEDYMFGALVLFILAAVCVGTACDARNNISEDNMEKTTVENALICFSLKSNWRKLYPSNQSEATRDLRPIEGVRTILTYFVINMHRFLFAATIGFVNPEWLEEAYQNPLKMIFFHIHPYVVAFFCISGFLLGYSIYRVLEKQPFTLKLFWQAIIYRYIRLTPAHALLIAFSVTWMRHMASGPLWPMVMQSEVEYCKNSWWTNLLYINNYVFPEKLCQLQTWYLAVDFQNYASALLVLWLVYKYKHHTKIIFGAAISIAMVLPAIQTYTERLNPAVLVYPEMIRDVLHDKTFLKNYITLEGNAAPYLVGVMFGAMFYKAKNNKLNISKMAEYLMVFYMLSVPAYVMYMSYGFYQPDYMYDRTSASIFAGVHKAALSAAMGMGLLTFCRTNEGKVNSVLCWRVLQVFSPITYCIYLVHLSIQRIDVVNMKAETIITDYFLIRKAATDFFFSACVAVILCLCVEMPSLALWKLYASSGKQDKTKKQ